MKRGPGKKWADKPAIIIYDDGREVCNLTKLAGRYAYYERIWLMWVRQDGRCCNCRRKLRMTDATFEHELGRTRARRDDRIAIDENGRFIRPINGASHLKCNHARGSRKTPIFHGNNFLYELEAA